MTSIPVRCSTHALVFAFILASSVALAQAPGEAPTAVAEALFQQARELVKQERYAEACPKFAESQRLDPKLGTLLNVAVCSEKLGKIATAWAAYTSAAAIARRDGQKERETFAREQVALLEKRLGRITLQVRAPEPGLLVRWDDQPLSGAALDTPFPVDPGKHVLSAVAPGRKPWSVTVEVPADKGEVIPVSVPPLEAESEPPPSVVPKVVVPPVVAAPPPAISSVPGQPARPVASALPEPAPRGDLRIVSYAAFGLGTAGLVVGAIVGGVTLSQADDIRARCTGNQCGEDQRAAIHTATTLSNVSNVSFVLGGLGLGAGVVTFVLSRPSSPGLVEKKLGAAVTPVIGPGVLGLRGRF